MSRERFGYTPETLIALQDFTLAQDAALRLNRHPVSNLIAIDAPITRHRYFDIDDAFLVMPQGDGWQVVVSIPDLTFLSSPLLEQATTRGWSHYNPYKPMLPIPIVRAANLWPGQIKPTHTIGFGVNKAGETEGMICFPSTYADLSLLTYHEADAQLAQPHEPGTIASLQVAKQCSDLLHQHRMQSPGILTEDDQFMTTAPRFHSPAEIW